MHSLIDPPPSVGDPTSYTSITREFFHVFQLNESRYMTVRQAKNFYNRLRGESDPNTNRSTLKTKIRAFEVRLDENQWILTRGETP